MGARDCEDCTPSCQFSNIDAAKVHSWGDITTLMIYSPSHPSSLKAFPGWQGAGDKNPAIAGGVCVHRAGSVLPVLLAVVHLLVQLLHRVTLAVASTLMAMQVARPRAAWWCKPPCAAGRHGAAAWSPSMAWTTLGGVDDVGVLAILDAIQNVRTTLVHLVHQTRVDARLAQSIACRGGVRLKPSSAAWRPGRPPVPCRRGERRAGRDLFSEPGDRPQLRLGIGLGEAAAHAHDFTGGAHFGPSSGSTPGNLLRTAAPLLSPSSNGGMISWVKPCSFRL